MENYEIVKADNEDFSRFYTIYQLGKYNIWFPATVQDSIDLYYKNFKVDAYWVHQNGKRIAGLLMKPNWFGLVFLIPPYHDEYTLMKVIVKHMIKISDPKKTITAYGVVPDIEKWLELFGFKVTETSKEMICASRLTEFNISDNVYEDVPKMEFLKEMADLYYDVFSKSNVDNLSNKPYEFYEDLLKGQIIDIDSRYSTVLHDKITNEIVGICTVQIWCGLPHILDILVKPTHQRRGLAEMMINKVLNTAYHNQYPAVCLSVEKGNSAEYLYHKLGFLSGVPSSKLELEI